MQVLLHPVAGKYLDRLDAPTKSRIKAALNGLEKEPLEGDISPVIGQTDYFRLKVGSYRVLYRIKNKVVFVTHIEPRGQAYTKKTRTKRG
jgi:mRNA interferase RelE/StbE